MPHPRLHAQATPNHPAIVMCGSGQTVTYGQLESNANQVAHLFRHYGLKKGDHIAMMMENHIRFFDIAWGALRAGIYFTPISTHLIKDEVQYIINNCEAQLFITTKSYEGVATQVANNAPLLKSRLVIGGEISGFESFESRLAEMPTTPIADECTGSSMLYSSGTTGVPKGVFTPPASDNILDINPIFISMGEAFKFGPHVKYLSPAPLYHAAPLAYNTVNFLYGGTSYIMEKFDVEKSLAYIDQFKINYSQWVPIMFVRMLKMPAEIRAKYDVSSMMLALHAAAPCPIEVKEKMIDWWGPVIFEYYGASEGNGMTAITSQEWLTHKGSVGKTINGTLHILNDDGKDVAAGQIGNVYFEGGNQFKYHNEPEKTEKSYAGVALSTVGDVGYVDDEGYLYLTDRKNFTIISGGVNIYPQEIENHLINHPKVTDVAVFGIPHPEFGQEVKAVIQPANWADQGDDLAEELRLFCMTKLAKIKIPKSFDFDPELPRKDNGKLYKRRLVERYL